MTAFLAALALIGRMPGSAFPAGPSLLSALGAAFACRSETTWPGRLGWTSNRFLVKAVVFEFVRLSIFLYFHPLASLLGHAPPNWAGLAVAAFAFPTVLLSDALYKQWIAWWERKVNS